MINLVSVGVCRGDSFAKRRGNDSRVEIEKFNGLPKLLSIQLSDEVKIKEKEGSNIMEKI
jgi:hypothetical protein